MPSSTPARSAFPNTPGAAAGFGLAVATRLAAEGARLVLVDRAAGALNEAAQRFDGTAGVDGYAGSTGSPPATSTRARHAR